MLMGAGGQNGASELKKYVEELQPRGRKLRKGIEEGERFAGGISPHGKCSENP